MSILRRARHLVEAHVGAPVVLAFQSQRRLSKLAHKRAEPPFGPPLWDLICCTC